MLLMKVVPSRLRPQWNSTLTAPPGDRVDKELHCTHKDRDRDKNTDRGSVLCCMGSGQTKSEVTVTGQEDRDYGLHLGSREGYKQKVQWGHCAPARRQKRVATRLPFVDIIMKVYFEKKKKFSLNCLS